MNAHKKEYLPIQGLPELRESISKYLNKKTGANYSKENILITPGSKEAMLLMHVSFNGEILTPAQVGYLMNRKQRSDQTKYTGWRLS